MLSIIVDRMNTPYKFVSPVDEAQILVLQQIVKDDPSARARLRAQRMLFSSKGSGIDDIANLFEVSRQTVSIRIDQWEQHGVASVYDHARSGAPAKFTATEIDLVKHLIEEHPHSPKIIFANIAEPVKNTISLSTFERIVKKHRLRWKRVRQSLRHQRDGDEFDQATRDIDQLNREQQCGHIALVDCDESGCSLQSQGPLPINQSEKP